MSSELPTVSEPPVQELLLRTLQRLSAVGVRWTLLRMPSHPHSPVGDVDLLVDRQDLRLLRAELGRLGFRNVPRAAERGSYVLYDAATDEWLWLDVATEIVSRERVLAEHVSAEVLGRSRWTGRLRVPHPADRFWLLLLHLVAERRRPRPHHRAALRNDVTATGALPALRHEVLRLLGSEWTSERLAGLISEDRWLDVELAIDQADAEMTSWRALTASAIARVRWLWRRIPTRARRGPSIALLGPDGAGKSSLATALRDTFFFPVHVVYMGTGLGSTASGSGRSRMLRFLSGTPVDPVGALLTQWWRYLIGAHYRARGYLVVFDRYTEAALLPPMGRLSRPRRFTRAVRRLLACPAPDIAVILDAPGPLMFARKGEHDPDELERMRRRYLALVHRYERALVIDASQPLEVSRAKLTGALWALYNERLGLPQA